MRISTLVCTAVLSLFGLTSFAQNAPLTPAVATPEEIDNDQLYTLTVPRGSFYAAEGASKVVSNKYPTAISYQKGELGFQFQFKKVDEVTYLWSEGAQKYVGHDTNLTDDPVDPIYVTSTGNGTYPLGLSFTEDRSDFNVQLGGSAQTIFDDWNSWDDGNQFAIVPIESTDNVIYASMVVYDADGNEVARDDTYGCETDSTVKIPASLERAFCNYTFEPAVAPSADAMDGMPTDAEGNPIFKVTVSYELPFTVSESLEEPTPVYLGMPWYPSNGNVAPDYIGPLVYSIEDGTITVANKQTYEGEGWENGVAADGSNTWYILGDPYAGFEIYNKAAIEAGQGAIIDAAEGETPANGTAPTVGETPTKWIFETGYDEYSDKFNQVTFGIKSPNVSEWWNNYGNENQVKYWQQSASANRGSCVAQFDPNNNTIVAKTTATITLQTNEGVTLETLADQSLVIGSTVTVPAKWQRDFVDWVIDPETVAENTTAVTMTATVRDLPFTVTEDASDPEYLTLGMPWTPDSLIWTEYAKNLAPIAYNDSNIIIVNNDTTLTEIQNNNPDALKWYIMGNVWDGFEVHNVAADNEGLLGVYATDAPADDVVPTFDAENQTYWRLGYGNDGFEEKVDTTYNNTIHTFALRTMDQSEFWNNSAWGGVVKFWNEPGTDNIGSILGISEGDLIQEFLDALDKERQATGINDVIATEKVINNGKTFNLAGQQVGKNYRGIVIRGGKKFIQK